jgi:hypothetical protein
MNTDELVAHGRSRFEHAAARRTLKEKYQAKLTFAHAGGMWQAGPELLATLSACTGPESVVLDLYETPIKITPNEFENKWLTNQFNPIPSFTIFDDEILV